MPKFQPFHPRHDTSDNYTTALYLFIHEYLSKFHAKVRLLPLQVLLVSFFVGSCCRKHIHCACFEGGFKMV